MLTIEDSDLNRIVLLNKRVLDIPGIKQTRHYTFNDLSKTGIPSSLLDGDSKLYQYGDTPREVIKSAQNLITEAGVENYRRVENEIATARTNI